MSHPKYKNIGHPAVRLIEECSELIKVVCKGQRFGWNNHHPDRPDANNEQEMDVEMRDIMEAYISLKEQILVDNK